MKRLVVFDLDGTLAESKSSIDRGMVALLNSLLEVTRLAVISGGDWPQFEKQVLSGAFEASRLANLSLLPTSGTKFYVHRADWEQLYAENLTDAQKDKITAAVQPRPSHWGSRPTRYGAQPSKTVEPRSLLGSRAGGTAQAKKGWDPDYEAEEDEHPPRRSHPRVLRSPRRDDVGRCHEAEHRQGVRDTETP